MPGTQWTHRTIKTEDYKYLIDIIEKQKEIILNDENYIGHARACYSNETRCCVCGLIAYIDKRKKLVALTE